jgi:hypothetical protein
MAYDGPSSWLGDLVTVLEQDGVGTYGENIFTSTKAALPMLPSGIISIVETGGSGADNTHNAVIRPAMVRPGAQITARADDQDKARALAHLAYDAFVVVRNQWINSGWYLKIAPQQLPFDGGFDSRSQSMSQFNVLGLVGIRPW